MARVKFIYTETLKITFFSSTRKERERPKGERPILVFNLIQFFFFLNEKYLLFFFIKPSKSREISPGLLNRTSSDLPCYVTVSFSLPVHLSLDIGMLCWRENSV